MTAAAPGLAPPKIRRTSIIIREMRCRADRPWWNVISNASRHTHVSHLCVEGLVTGFLRILTIGLQLLESDRYLSLVLALLEATS